MSISVLPPGAGSGRLASAILAESTGEGRATAGAGVVSCCGLAGVWVVVSVRPGRGGRREPDFEQDWKNYVEPDLRSLFRSTQEIVEGDLKRFDPDESGDSSTLRIPVKNLEAWIHTLNQARLAIAARYDFTDKEMEKQLSLGSGARSLALFQVHFYGFLQECFLQQLDAP